MRRPLFCCSLCLVMLIALGYYGLPASVGGGPPDGEYITLTGQVCQKDGTSFVIKISEAAIQKVQNNATVLWQDNPTHNTLLQKLYNKINATDKIICEYEAAEGLLLGSVITVRGSFYAFLPATNPGEFDYARYYHAMGYGGRLKAVEILAQKQAAPGVREALHRLRNFWEERLYRIFPKKEASVMAAILLGDKSGVDADVKALYQRNGIIHILSISGLHITLLGMGLYKLLRRLGMPVWCAALCGALTLGLYGIMTGLGVSVCRALGMYLLRMLAQLPGRTYDMLTALGAVAAVMACIHPAWLGHMGFLLSFGSVLGVGVLMPALAYREEKPPELRRYVEGRGQRCLIKLRDTLGDALRQSFLAGLSVTLTTLPVQLWFTYEMPVYSVLLNILILPFMSVVMAAGLIAMLIPGLGIVGTADALILAGYEALCGWFGELPHPMWNPGRPGLWQVAVYYLLWAAAVCGGGILRRRRGKEPMRRGFFAGVKGAQLILLWAAVLVMGFSGTGGDRVTFLDVGQGDCICVQLSSGEVYLFDCGSSSRSRIGERVLIPFLKYYGIGRIDAVFVSHADQDHMNGIVELLAQSREEHIEVGRLVLPGIDRALWQEEFGELLAAAADAGGGAAVPVTVIRAGERWSGGWHDEDSFLCLHPAGDGSGRGGNEGSECFYIELQEGTNKISLLLAGDVEGAGERQLFIELKERAIRDVTVYKAAHHGSKNSTSRELLEQIRPKVSIISCGRNNRYGHPHEELLKRLEQTGTLVYDTPQYGAITLEIKDGGVSINPP